MAGKSATRVCVTGATGFLASELVAQLLGHGYHVSATVRSLANRERNACLHDLPGASSESLTLFEANLLDEGAFDECVAGAKYVFHTASPFVTSNITDPQSQLVRPAVDGTRNVFGSIARAVASGHQRPRVVVTSSVAAMLATFADKDSCFDESDWNTLSRAEGNPPGDGLDMYRFSKVAAEREAWAQAAAQQLELATVLPSFIVGPPRTPRTDGESLRNMRQALEGTMPHRADTPMVDVRDVAAAHVAAAETATAANKRFLVTSPQAIPRAHVLRLLAAQYPGFQIADAGEPPDAASLRQLFCGKNTAAVLGITPRSVDDSLLDMAAAMLSFGVVQPRPRAEAAAPREEL